MQHQATKLAVRPTYSNVQTLTKLPELVPTHVSHESEQVLHLSSRLTVSAP